MDNHADVGTMEAIQCHVQKTREEAWWEKKKIEAEGRTSETWREGTLFLSS